MKEMLSNLADGQIELYKSVSDVLVFSEPPYQSMLGHGRVGQDHSDYSAHTRGRLAHFVLHIPMFISNRTCLGRRILCPSACSYQGFSIISSAETYSPFDPDTRFANVRNLSADS